MLDSKWHNILNSLDYAFQPIVNSYSGTLFGFEALLRGYKESGFDTIDSLLNQAYYEQSLYSLDLELRKKAFLKFKKSRYKDKSVLFYNIDSRILQMPNFKIGNTKEFLKSIDLNINSIAFEISEKFDSNSFNDTKSLLTIYKQQGFKISIDKFANDFCGLKYLYHLEPDFIKLDRFYMVDIIDDYKKRLFIRNILNVAKTMGITSIALGVESELEYFLYKDFGVSLMQGFFVSKPKREIELFTNRYDEIEKLANKDSRHKSSREIIESKLSKLEPICVTLDLNHVFDIFRKNKEHFLPVVDEMNHPLGILKEETLREYVYSQYGKSILLNKYKNIESFITKCGVADLETDLEKVLEIFSFTDTAFGLIISSNEEYVGFLSAKSLLNIINERNLMQASEQNPLTKLAGNNPINRYISKAIASVEKEFFLVYFDFDNFKPFNDKYGFRKGDRAILLFADIFKKILGDKNCFIGHIGGDDFFCAFEANQNSFFEIHSLIDTLVTKFKSDVESFYDLEDRERGYIIAKDRDGNKKKFPLLTVSSAILGLPLKRDTLSDDEIGEILANLKKSAKNPLTKIASACAITIF